MPHSESCRKRLTEEIEKGDGSDRVKRARERELEFYERALKDSDQVSKRKAGETGEGDSKKKKVDEEGERASGSGLVRAGEGAAGGGPRGEKRPAEDPPADQGRGDPVGQEAEKGDEDASMDYVGFREYNDDGGLWMVACHEPDEDVEELRSAGWGEGRLDEDGAAEFRDDRTGKPLDTEKVRAAREEELRELDRRVWEEADVQECWDKKGRGPIGVRWVDVDKGFGVHRSRLVAKDFKPRSKINDKEGLFAATPPLELVKMIIVKAARGDVKKKGVRKVMFLDISKAHLGAARLH